MSLNSSPVKRSIQGSQPWGSSHMDAIALKKCIESELCFHWVGPMPVDKFLEAFLHTGKERLEKRPKIPNDYFNALPQKVQEPKLYQPFIDLVTKSGVAPTLQFLNASDHADIDTITNMKNKPDVVAYDSKAVVNPHQPTSYSKCEIIFEFKPWNGIVDPFNHPVENASEKAQDKYVFEPSAIARLQCRGQLACYARIWCARQHLTHCFVVWIGDPYARIIRFDRAGAIVTERFNIRNDGDLLCDFLWRMSWASPEVRGKDKTVSVVEDPAEIKLAKEKLKEWGHTGTRDILKLLVSDGGSVEDPKWREVLVWGPLADPQCVIGRATRGYPAWDLKDNRQVFVKDSWRAVLADISKETDILRKLNQAQVCNVPIIVCGDDLPEQVTRTRDFASEMWNMGGGPEVFAKRVHVRFISDFVGRHLATFTESKQFVRAWLDALIAHREAYTKCKILHRDISLNNILFNSAGRGILNDWDLARTLEEIESGPRQPSRSGTWQFMSIDLLSYPGKKHTLQDDLEAFFWALLYVPIRYLGTSLSASGADIVGEMKIIFDEVFNLVRVPGPQVIGGAHKERLIIHRARITPNFSVTDNAPFTTLIDEIIAIIKSYRMHFIIRTEAIQQICRRKKISFDAATELYNATANTGVPTLDFGDHDAMIELANDALNEEWPTGDGAADHLAKTSERRANTSMASGSLQGKRPRNT